MVHVIGIRAWPSGEGTWRTTVVVVLVYYGTWRSREAAKHSRPRRFSVLVLPVVYFANSTLGGRWTWRQQQQGRDAGTWRDAGATAAGLGAMQGTAAPGTWRGGRTAGEDEIHPILAEHAGGNVVRPKGQRPWRHG